MSQKEQRLKIDVLRLIGKFRDIIIAFELLKEIPILDRTEHTREQAASLINSLFVDAHILFDKLLAEGYYTDKQGE